MNGAGEAVLTIAMGIIGVAALAVFVSRNANTSAVIQSAGSAFGNSLAVAESPVTGNAVAINTSYPNAFNEW